MAEIVFHFLAHFLHFLYKTYLNVDMISVAFLMVVIDYWLLTHDLICCHNFPYVQNGFKIAQGLLNREVKIRRS